jgi:hypothetical protein
MEYVVLFARCVRWVALIALSAMSASYAQVPPRRPDAMDLLKNCPEGHRIEFVLPTATLYVEVHRLESVSLIDLFEKRGATCPSTPVQVDQIYLRGPPRQLKHEGGPGVVLSRLVVSEPPRKGLLVGPPITDDGGKHAGAWIEDWTDWPPKADPAAHIRRYRLHQPADDRADPVIDIICGGPAGRLRNCSPFTTYLFHDLGVHYQLIQPNLPIPEGAQNTSADPATEPGALLQFDSTLRLWLINLEHPR